MAAASASTRDVHVRPLARADLPALAERLPEFPGRVHEDDVRDHESGCVSVLVAWDHGVPLGSGMIAWSGPREPAVARSLGAVPEIYRLWVSDAQRSRGVGTRLVTALEDLAVSRGCDRAGLGVALENPRASALYERLGYRDAGQRTYHDVWHHRDLSGRAVEIRDECRFLVKPLGVARLVLFDLDGTLLSSRGSGRAAMRAAGARLFGRPFDFDSVDVNGRLDPLIWADLARGNGVDEPALHEPRFRAAYLEELTRAFDTGSEVHALDGVRALLERLRLRTHLEIGVLSGNYPETGRLKLVAAGIDPHQFRICAWAGDAPSRPELVPIALERYRGHHGRPLDARSVVVVGDTPQDVKCAHAHGARVIAVATGHYSVDELVQTGADHVLPSLADIAEVERCITAAPLIV